MNEPTVNIPLLREVVEWVEWQDTLDVAKRSWNQEIWYLDVSKRLDGEIQGDAPDIYDNGFSATVVNERPECGTAMCVAGYVTQFHRPEGVIRVGENLIDHESGDAVTHSDLATRVLGLDEYQAEELFDSVNGATDVRRIAESIAGERL